VTVTGYAAGPTVDVFARNWSKTPSTQDRVASISVPRSTPVSTSLGTLYRWTAVLSLSPAAYPQYWVPPIPQPTTGRQPNGAGLLNPATGEGRLELSIQEPAIDLVSRSRELGTFSQAGQTCFRTATEQSADLALAGESCADGAALVLFDNGGDDGVDNVAAQPARTWTTRAGPYDSPTVNPTATWEVGQYSTIDDVDVYAFMCRPVGQGRAVDTTRSYPLQIYNHGGFGGINGTVNADGNDDFADELGLCLNAAKQGWIGAASSYRGEGVTVQDTTGSGHGYSSPAGDHEGSGTVEYCLGEVTDVQALLSYLIGLGRSFPTGLATSTWKPAVTPDEVLMWGWSHGGCVTQRAVQQGAAVNAAVTFAAITDDATYYNACRDYALGSLSSCLWSEGFDATEWAGMHGATGRNTQGELPMAYDWRSPSWFESLGVGVAPLGPPFVNDTTARHPGALRARPDVPFLMLQGGQDHVIGASQACELSEAMGSACNNWYVDTDASGMTSINSWCPAAAYPSLASWNPGPADLTQAKHNLVWITGDNHAGEANGRGILYDYVAWEYFGAFVAGLGWGLRVAPMGWAPVPPPTSS